MSIQRGLSPYQVPPTDWRKVQAHGLVLSATGEVLLRRDEAGWQTLRVFESGVEESAEPLELLEGLLPTLGIEPLSYRWLTTWDRPEAEQSAAFYVVEEWQPRSKLHPDLHFFSLEALPAALAPLEQQALELLRVCWGWSTE